MGDVGDDGPGGSYETQVGEEYDEKGESEAQKSGVCVRILISVGVVGTDVCVM